MTPRIRFGGVQTPRGYRFELTGGRACLDFANTLDERRRDRPRELLPRYDDLLNWAAQAGVASRSDVALLRDQARRDPRSARRAAGRARRAREALFDLFSALARNEHPSVVTLTAINRLLTQAAAARQLVRRGDRFVWTWGGANRRDLDRLLWPVAWSAAELLASPDVARVRQCGGAGCAWLFLDMSKNQSRRWCDMSICGNRAKARRFREQAKLRC